MTQNLRTAVVLAGGTRDDVCRDDAAAPNKAFVTVCGAPMVTHALRALREAATIGHIIVVAPEAASGAVLVLADERRVAGEKISDSLHNGLAGLDPNEPVLLCAADLPLLTPMAIDDFVERAALQAGGSDIAYGYLERRRHELVYPEIRHTWARFREGVFCGTGLCTMRPRILADLTHTLDAASAARKAPWRLAAMLGPSIVLHYALGILGIRETEERIGKLLRGHVRGVASLFPETAVNVDRPSDLEYFRKRC